MALILEDVYQETRQQFHLKLAAGEAGLCNVIKWVSAVEDDSTFSFLRGGELLLTTGVVFCNNPGGLIHFLRRAVSQGSCGLIINTGKYVGPEDVTQEIVDFCNAHRYPLFLMPWHIHFYDFTWEYCNRIFLDTNRNEELNNALLCLMEPDLEHQDALIELAENGLPEHAPYVVAVLGFKAPGGLSPERSLAVTDNSWLAYQIDQLLVSQPFRCHLIRQRLSYLFVCQTADFTAVETLLRQVLLAVREHYEDLPLFVGLGGQSENLSDLSKSYQQALGALKLGRYRGKTFSRYEDMGFMKLLLAVSDREVLQTYADDRLRAVREYDLQNKRNFARTLSLYLFCQGNVQEVAKASFCHRNTVNHRLQILTEKLGYRLDDPTERFELMTAFWVEEYLKLDDH